MKSRLLLALALQRLEFLRSDEKLLVWDLIDDETRLAVLSLRDVETIVCRRLEGRRWSPATLLAEAERDALYLERIGARYLHFDDPAYPPLLR
ncbi:MAG TPA: hypothetical protein VFL04_03500, partial [Rectinemataceae bacterium]|nr:hypothetical protein [Rectinemataceae bacterium]